MRLRVGHQHSQFWPILACFMDYYSLFWGPGLISTSNEPSGAFMCRYQHSQFWPILTRFVDYYSPFWGPKVISMVVEPQGVLYVVKTRSLVKFWPVSWTITQFWGPGAISTIDEPRGAFTCRS